MNKNLKINWKLVKKISNSYCDFHKRKRYSLIELKKMLQGCYDTMETNLSMTNVKHYIFSIERKKSVDPNIPVCLVNIEFKLDYWFENYEK